MTFYVEPSKCNLPGMCNQSGSESVAVATGDKNLFTAKLLLPGQSNFHYLA